MVIRWICITGQTQLCVTVKDYWNIRYTTVDQCRPSSVVKEYLVCSSSFESPREECVHWGEEDTWRHWVLTWTCADPSFPPLSICKKYYCSHASTCITPPHHQQFVYGRWTSGNPTGPHTESQCYVMRRTSGHTWFHNTVTYIVYKNNRADKLLVV